MTDDSSRIAAEAFLDLDLHKALAEEIALQAGERAAFEGLVLDLLNRAGIVDMKTISRVAGEHAAMSRTERLREYLQSLSDLYATPEAAPGPSLRLIDGGRVRE